MNSILQEPIGAKQSDFESVTTAKGVRWLPRIQNAEQERQALAMAQQLGVSDLLARVMAGRGITIETAHDFLNPTLKQSLPDPMHLKDMDKAVDRLRQAIKNKETIAVFGDYDVDGATSSALLKRYFAALGLDLLIYIPDRMKEGYGPNIEAFHELHKQEASLIITVDCGTVAYDPIAHITDKGVDVMVIDHHIAQPELPKACAVVNPNRVDQDSDCGNMAAVGVVFMVLVALNRALREDGFFQQHHEPNLMHWLDMVALGTICDVVPIVGVNRAIVTQGLKVMMGRTNPGITAICDLTHLDETPSTYHAGFIIGPRINAGGRVGESALGSQLLSQDDPMVCHQIAQKLDRYNAERQAIESSVLEAAMAQAEKQTNQPCIVVSSHGWHEGVIGIVAGRIKEQFHRPAAVVTIHDGIGKGSARSVAGADIGAAVNAAKMQGMLLAGGGHSAAAGFSVAEDQLDAFIAYLNERLEQAVANYASERAWLYDGMVSASGITLKLMDALEQAGPYGMGNPGPKIIVPNAQIITCDRMKEKHLRTIVTDGVGSKGRMTAVCFNAFDTPLGNLLEGSVGKRVHLAGSVKRNFWNGIESVQFMLEDAALA